MLVADSTDTTATNRCQVPLVFRVHGVRNLPVGQTLLCHVAHVPVALAYASVSVAMMTFQCTSGLQPANVCLLLSRPVVARPPMRPIRYAETCQP